MTMFTLIQLLLMILLASAISSAIGVIGGFYIYKNNATKIAAAQAKIAADEAALDAALTAKATSVIEAFKTGVADVEKIKAILK
jgi:hypothetical protein